MTLDEIIDKTEDDMIYRQADRDVILGYLRYETIRQLNPREFQDLWRRNLATGTPFDTLVDELIISNHTA